MTLNVEQKHKWTYTQFLADLKKKNALQLI